jgi:hypothetical protein
MRRHRVLSLVSLAIGATLAATIPAAAPVRAPSRSPAALEPLALAGGIADAGGRVGYLSNARGGIDAVDLKTGELIWENTEAQRPLLIVGSRLLAQAGVKRNRLRILALDLARGGECVLESDPVVLPSWVVTGEAPGHSFEARWHVRHNRLILAWEASAWHAGPVRATKQQEAAARRHAAGTSRIDLDTGEVETGPPDAPVLPTPEPPAAALEKKSLRWQGEFAGHTFALVLEESASGEQAFLLYAWDTETGKAGPPLELLRGRRLVAQASLDGRFLCLRAAPPPPDERGLRRITREHAWLLVPLEVGRPVARLAYEPGTQAISVLGTRAYYAVAGGLHGPLDRPQPVARVLKAVDLTTEKTLWEHPIAGRPVAPPVR